MSGPALALIAAVARNGVIGRDNGLPWRLPDDLRHFKALTLGHSVIMGRKTWESLGRPLPQRRNIVITRQQGFSAEGASIVHSLEEALALCKDSDRVFCIGGAQLYAQSLPLADALHLTEVHADIDGDACFPSFDRSQYTEAAREDHPADTRNEYPFSFVTLLRTA